MPQHSRQLVIGVIDETGNECEVRNERSNELQERRLVTKSDNGPNDGVTNRATDSCNRFRCVPTQAAKKEQAQLGAGARLAVAAVVHDATALEQNRPEPISVLFL
jgi:hypothetical protein